MNDTGARKTAAAEAAVAEVASGTVLGLGSGSTAARFLHALAAATQAGTLHGVRGVATSRATERLARELGIPLLDLPAEGVDVAVDGMDEVDADLNAVKGLGGALLREKVVAASATRFVLIGGEEKQVERLGGSVPLPVEVLAFGVARTAARLRALGLDPRLRGGESEPFLTDNQQPVLDCGVPEHVDVHALARELDAIPGVLGHGLFLGMAEVAYLAGPDGVRALRRTA